MGENPKKSVIKVVLIKIRRFWKNALRKVEYGGYFKLKERSGLMGKNVKKTGKNPR